jgi:hypothetical protein
MKMNKKYIECECQSFDHIGRFVWFDDEKMDEHWALYFDFELDHYLPWYKRIMAALRFIFKKESIGQYDCLILNQQAVVDLRDFLNERLNNDENNKVG